MNKNVGISPKLHARLLEIQQQTAIAGDKQPLKDIIIDAMESIYGKPEVQDEL